MICIYKQSEVVKKTTRKSWGETFVSACRPPAGRHRSPRLKIRCLAVRATGGSACSLCVHSQPTRYCLLYTHPIIPPPLPPRALLHSFILFFYERDYIEEVRQCVRTGYKQIHSHNPPGLQRHSFCKNLYELKWGKCS